MKFWEVIIVLVTAIACAFMTAVGVARAVMFVGIIVGLPDGDAGVRSFAAVFAVLSGIIGCAVGAAAGMRLVE